MDYLKNFEKILENINFKNKFFVFSDSGDNNLVIRKLISQIVVEQIVLSDFDFEIFIKTIVDIVKKKYISFSKKEFRDLFDYINFMIDKFFEQNLLKTIVNCSRHYKQIILNSSLIEDEKNKFLLKIFNIAGIVYFKLNNYPKSEEYFSAVFTKAKELKDRSSLIMAMGNIANIKIKEGKLDKALHVFEEILSFLSMENEQDKRYARICYINMGELYLNKADYNEALNFYQKAVLLAEKLNDKRGMAFGYNGLAAVFICLDYTNRAKAVLQKALKFANEIKAYDTIFRITINLSDIFLRENDLKQADEILSKAVKLANQLEDYEFFIVLCTITARLYYRKFLYKEALQELEKGYKLTQIHDHKREELNILIEFGRIYYDLGDFAKASNSLEEVLRKNEDSKFSDIDLVAYSYLAKVKCQQNRIAEARKLIKKSSKLLNENNSKNFLIAKYTKLYTEHCAKNYDYVLKEADKTIDLAISKGHQREIFDLRLTKISTKIATKINQDEIEDFIKILKNYLVQYQWKEVYLEEMIFVYYYLYRLNCFKQDGENQAESYRKKAILLTEKMYQKIPKFYYKRILDELAIFQDNKK